MDNKQIGRRTALKQLSTIGAGGAFLSSGLIPTSWGQSKTGKRPNILLIYSDDHARHAISAYGSKINQTPNLDRIAQEGAIFRNAFCANSICAPARATLLTGQHSHINGKKNNFDKLNPNYINFPSLLQESGYDTALVGKWHIPETPRGFDYWEILATGQGQYYNPDFKTADNSKQYEGYVTDITTDLALQWLDRRDEQENPFLLMVHHKAPHRTWMPSPKHLSLYDDVTIPEPDNLFDDYVTRTSAAPKHAMGIAEHLMMAYDLQCPMDESEKHYAAWKRFMERMTESQLAAWNAYFEPRNEAFRKANLQGEELTHWKYQRYIKNYLRCIASIDDNVGRILDYLEHQGLADNTIVIYTSDQGFYLGDHGWFDKRWMYEESLTCPLMMRWPAQVQSGTQIGELVQNIDFAPTFTDLANVSIPAEMQGESLLPLLRGEHPADWRESIYYRYYESPSEHIVPRHFGVRTERYKLIRYFEIDEWELFDLEKDPREMHNVYADPEYQEIGFKLKKELQRLQEYYKDTGP